MYIIVCVNMQCIPVLVGMSKSQGKTLKLTEIYIQQKFSATAYHLLQIV